MDSREVNEIVVKMLAAADKIDRHNSREREEILHLVGRLGRAATRERATAFDKMHYLDRKIRQLQNELRLLEPGNPLLRRSPVKSASQARSGPLAGAHDRPRDDLLQAPRHRTTPLLNYGPEEDRVPPRPDNVTQPTRKIAGAGNAPVAPVAPVVAPREQAHAPARVLAAPAAAPPLQVATQKRAEYGHFNEVRLLAITAHAGSDGDSDCSSGPAPVPAPAPPVPSFTNANTEPVAPRRKRRETSIEGPASIARAADELSRDVSNRVAALAGQKRKASDASTTEAAVSELNVVGGMTMPFVFTSAVKHGTTIPTPVKHARPSCIRCVVVANINCNGQNQCHNCRGKFKCKYVLCEVENCKDVGCVKIHSSQYDINQKPKGQPRRVLVYDNKATKDLTVAEKEDFETALARMNAMRKEVPLLSSLTGQAKRAKTKEEDQHAQRAPVFGTNPRELRDAQGPLPAGAIVFGSSAWQTTGSQLSGKGVDRGEPIFGSGSLAPTQNDPFRLPQAVQNATLKAQMSAAFEALSVRIGTVFRKDSFWSGDPHIKAEESDD